MTIVLATAICLALTYVFTVKQYRTDDSQLSEPRETGPALGIQIICGNCSGEGKRPVKTHLGRYGNCERCGGHSFILPVN
jgi:hypothetical protein